jgi:hypothetical protein
MTNEQNELKHELVVGRCEAGKLLLPKNAGLATCRDQRCRRPG